MHLNYIDVGIIIIIFFFGIKGFCIGLVRSLFNLVKYIFSLFLCKLYYKTIVGYFLEKKEIIEFTTKYIEKIFINIAHQDALVTLITKIVIEGVVILGIFFLSNFVLRIAVDILEKIFRIKILNIVNKGTGFIFGSMKGTLFLLLVLTLIHPFLGLFEKEKLIVDLNNSLLLKYLYMYNFVFKYFNHFIEIFNKYNISGML